MTGMAKPKPKKKRTRYRGPSPADLAHTRKATREQLLSLDSRVSKLEILLIEIAKKLSGSEEI